MFTIERIAAELRKESRTLDFATFDGRDAARLTKVAAEAERLCAAIKLGFAKRAADTKGWHRDSHATTEEQWLAGISGTTEHQARDALSTAERLKELPATEEKMRDGSLSMTQANLVSKAAAANPDAEDTMLRSAERDGVRGLRERAERVIAAATDEGEAHDRAKKERHLRTWRKGMATCGSFSGPTEEVAALLRALEPLAKARFERARKAGRRITYEARMFDALIDLAKASRTDTDGSGSSSAVGVTDAPVTRIRVDLERLLGRHSERGGELCEIPGVGPVPVAWARHVLPHGLLELVITDGVDVRTVVTRTRHVPEALKLAIDERDERCKIRGCDVTHGLERHHVFDFATHRLTTYELLGRLCGDHHDLVTYRGDTIEAHDDGTWSLRPPAERPEEGRQPHAA